ncbi:MAG: cell division site-positioning protein MapZ family protein, partial [Vagococcus sp.]
DLFKSPIMVGKELKEDVLVKNSSPITLTRVSEEKDGFDILFNKAFDEAEKQKNQLVAINEKLDQLIKDDSVVKTATRKQYEETEDMIKALKDEDAKKDYLAKLKKVDTYLVDSEKKKQEAEELARQAEEQRLAELNQQNQTNTTTQTIAPTTPTGPGGNYKWGNRQDAYIDYNDAAWGWAPGVQEKVIAEVISRGYVVEGGYTLVPKYIENGEGFYDLYATTNSKIFPKSKPEEFPLYVVTINAKTGWFKGNGPN